MQAGEPYGVIVGNKFRRDPQSGQLLINQNGLSSFEGAKIEKIGDPNPNYTAGITNTFTYKGIALSFLIDIRKGGDIISRNTRDLRLRGVAVETGNRDQKYVIAGVVEDPANPGQALRGGDGQPVPNAVELTAEQYYKNLYNSFQGENMIFDGSWVRLREASITYNLPKALISKTPFGAIQIAITGRNLLLSSPNFPHLDPEANSQGVSNSQGFQYNTLPQARTYGALLRLTF